MITLRAPNHPKSPADESGPPPPHLCGVLSSLSPPPPRTLLLAKALPGQESGPGQAWCSRRPEVPAFGSPNIATIGVMI